MHSGAAYNLEAQSAAYIYPKPTYIIPLKPQTSTMSLKSDLTIDASKFDRKLADKQTQEFNEKLIKIWADGPRWYEVSCLT
jgi:hypothetical protein